MKRKSVLIIAAFVIAALVAPPVHAAVEGASGTRILGIRMSIKGNHTRLIFDAEGPRPKQVGPASADGISVFFNQMSAKIPDKKIGNAAAAAKDIKFRRESGFFEVLFREKDTSVHHQVNNGKKPGRFTLVLDLTAPAKTAASASETKEPTKEKTAVEEPVKRIDSNDLFSSNTPLGLKELLQKDEKKRPDGGGERSAAQRSQPFVDMDERTAALYGVANDKFESCQRNLVLCGSEVIEAYGEAIKAGPKASPAPLGHYRAGLAHSSMGNYAKAERFFRQVISEWPDQPPAARCWIGLGDIHNKKQGYFEAMEAFRTALRIASDKADRAAAYFELGRQYLLLGVPKEALEMFSQCVGQEPEYYTKTPELVRLIGEAEFALGMYDKSKEHLLRYVNCQQSATDQDIVYAKIAEILLNQGEIGLANKMHAFINKYFTDSEGDLISRIRHAELLERTNQKKSIEIFDELRSKDLSPHLRRIVYFKLAMLNWKKGNLESSLALMDDVFQGRTDASPNNEMSTLREKILAELVKKFFAEKNYLAVIQLHDRFRKIFDTTQQSTEVFEAVAESYVAMKFYSNALEIYDRLLAKSQKKNEELLLRCAIYSLRMGDQGKSSQYCKQIQAESLDLKKSEVMGQLSFRDQKYADAVKYFSKVLQKQKEFELTDPDSFQSYGQTLLEMKKFDEAIPILQKGLDRTKPEDSDNRHAILVMIGKCYTELKQFVKAAEMMEAALRIAKDEQANELLYEIAKLYVAAGQPEKAVVNLNMLIGSQNPFWSAVAQQQLNSIQMAQMSQSR